MTRIKSAAFDMLLNVLATLVPMAVLQLAILPLVARGMSDEAYGVVLASVALLGLIPLTAGNVINNVRLLRDADYAESEVRGDFPVIVSVACAACAVAVGLGSFIVGVIGVPDLLAVSLASVLMLSREYLVVEYRLKLNYRGILYANLWQTLGQVLGLLLYFATGVWALVYLAAYLASDLYLLRTTSLWREPFSLTAKVGGTLRDVGTLGVANVLNKLTNYADRLVLVPLAGSASVAVYYVSCLFGKVLSLLVSPINNVLLSYLVKERETSRKGFALALSSAGVLCLVGYAVTMLLAEPLISLVYPQYVAAAMEYVPASTAASYVMVLSNVANPFVMRFCDLRWQIATNAAFCAVFFVGSVLGFFAAGLLGFCWGVCVANCVRLLLAVALFLSKSR